MILSDVPLDTIAQVEQIGQSGITIPNIADWITIIAFPLTLFGLFWTYRQSRKTKNAAEAAKTSAQQTSKKLESFQSIANLSKNIEILKTCPKLLADENWWETATCLRDVRDQLIALIGNENSLDQKKRLNGLKDQINVDMRNLRAKSYDDTIELHLEDIFDRIEAIYEIFVVKQTEIKNM